MHIDVGQNKMAQIKRSWLRKVTIALLILADGYLLWVLVPFNKNVRVFDTAGLADQDVEAAVNYARSQGAYSEGWVEMLSDQSRWTPWKRGHLLIQIEGTSDRIHVRSGFSGGPLFGGGPTFDGVKNADGWQFKLSGMWVS